MNQDCPYYNNIIQYCWYDNLMSEKKQSSTVQVNCFTENLWDGLIYVGNIETSWRGSKDFWVPWYYQQVVQKPLCVTWCKHNAEYFE